MTRLCGVAILAGLIVSRPAFGQEDAGKTAYVRVCETRHGPGGKGGGQGPALVPFDIELPELLTIVRQGIGMMPAIPRDRITDEEIAQVRAYLISLSHEPADRSFVPPSPPMLQSNYQITRLPDYQIH